MSRKWRWSLLGILIAIVVSGLMPNAFLSGAETHAGNTIATTLSWGKVEMAGAPIACAEASCGKGVPAPSAPSLTMVAAAAMVGVLALAALGRKTRRQRFATATLPSGNFTGLFRPPQYS